MRSYCRTERVRQRRFSYSQRAKKAKEAEEAGADYVGADEMAKKIQTENWFDFDVVVATPDMMGVVGRLGKILGPKGLMPNPKSGTVTMNVTQALNEIKAGKVEYRLDKTNIIHTPIGKMSFGPEKLKENFDALLEAVVKAKAGSGEGSVPEKRHGFIYDGTWNQNQSASSFHRVIFTGENGERSVNGLKNRIEYKP